MPRHDRKQVRRFALIGAVAACGCTSLFAFDEPARISTSDPLKARSAEANIVGGKIVSDQEKRLDATERAQEELGATRNPAKVIVPAVGPAGANPAAPKAAVDVAPQPHVDIGLETALNDHGVLVTRVKPGSPAAEAKFLVDDLIRKVDDRSTLTAKDLDVEFHEHPPLAKLPVVVRRQDEEIKLTLTLPASHEPHAPPPPFSLGDPSGSTGQLTEKKVRAEDIVRDEAIGWVLGERGERLVEILSILPDSPAARASLLPNDVILGVDRQRYFEPATVSVAVHQHQSGEVALLHVRRGTREADVALVLPNPDAAVAGVPAVAGGNLVAQPGVTVTVPFGTTPSTLPAAPPPGVAPGTNGVNGQLQAVPPGTLNSNQRDPLQPATPGARVVNPLQSSGENFQRPGDVLQAPPPQAGGIAPGTAPAPAGATPTGN